SQPSGGPQRGRLQCGDRCGRRPARRPEARHQIVAARNEKEGYVGEPWVPPRVFTWKWASVRDSDAYEAVERRRPCQLEREHRSTRPRCSAPTASHERGELTRDRQSKPGARRNSLLDAVEPLEDPLELVDRNPGAVVLHLEPGVCVARA